jgi:ABC-type lipoprotein export system ATPase subunit
VEIVRAFLRGPAIVVADDPTRGLPVQAERGIEQALRTLATSAGATLVIASTSDGLTSRLEPLFELAHRGLRPRA